MQRVQLWKNSVCQIISAQLYIISAKGIKQIVNALLRTGIYDYECILSELNI